VECCTIGRYWLMVAGCWLGWGFVLRVPAMDRCPKVGTSGMDGGWGDGRMGG